MTLNANITFAVTHVDKLEDQQGWGRTYPLVYEVWERLFYDMKAG